MLLVCFYAPNVVLGGLGGGGGDGGWGGVERDRDMKYFYMYIVPQVHYFFLTRKV